MELGTCSCRVVSKLIFCVALFSHLVVGVNLVLFNMWILLRKIALPYPHKCLLGFVEAKRGDQQEYLKIILVREVNPVVSDRCACAQPIVGWTLWRDPHSIFGRRGGCAFFFRRSSWRSHS